MSPVKVVIPRTRMLTLSKLVNQAEEEENEDWGLPPDLRRMVEQEEREMKPHQKEHDPNRNLPLEPTLYVLNPRTKEKL